MLDYLSAVVSGWGDTGFAEMFSYFVKTDGQYCPASGKEIVGFEWIIGNATNAITMTGKIYDPYGVAVHTKAALAKNATTLEQLPTTGDIPIICAGCKVGFTPSGDSGVIHITGQVRVFYKE